MCRGCKITIAGKPATYEYLEWLDKYQSIVRQMKELNKTLLIFEGSVDPEFKKTISKFRRTLIRLQKEYAKADEILNEVNIIKGVKITTELTGTWEEGKPEQNLVPVAVSSKEPTQGK